MRQIYDALLGVAYDAIPGNMALGAIWMDNASGKVYKFIQYSVGTGVVAGVLGNACGYTSTGYPLNQVTSDQSDTANITAGVLLCAMTNLQYGWIQIEGLATCNITFTGPPVAGNSLKLSATDGAFAVSTAATEYLNVVCLHVINKQVLLQCPW